MYTQLLKQKNKQFILLLCFALFPVVSWGLTQDVEKPVNIEADTVMFDNEKGVADYQGNVIIIQGSLEIRADKVNIQAPDHEISLIVATGSPVKLHQEMDDGEIVQGQGNKVTYKVKDKRIVLVDNAKLEQGKDVISNNHIEYLPDSGELYAGGKKGAGRVKAIFHPTNKADKPAKNKNDAAKK